MEEILASVRGRARSFSAHFDQLVESLEGIARGGKRVRSRMLMDAYAALGGTEERVAIEVACAVELLHIALVVHDDVIDKDLMRRGEPNITGRFATNAMLLGADTDDARTWGEASSILAGDLMLTLAHSVLARIDIDPERRNAMLDVFADAVHESAAGEHRDVWLSLHLEQTGPEEVLDMVEQKTAAYSFQAPLTLAAILAGAEPFIIEQLVEIARRIGVIYQLRDDVLGIFGDERITGKSTLSDLREGKQTLLVAYACSAAAWADVAPLFGDEQLDEAGGRRLRRTIEDSGALTLVESVIADRCTEVHRLIRDASIPNALREQLAALTYASSSRDS